MSRFLWFTVYLIKKSAFQPKGTTHVHYRIYKHYFIPPLALPLGPPSYIWPLVCYPRYTSGSATAMLGVTVWSCYLPG